MHEPINSDRRTFLRRGAMGAGALWMLSLGELSARRRVERSTAASPYGSLVPVADETTGLPLLMLPEGFRYASFGWTGDVMSDGLRCPGAHDGMAVVERHGANEHEIVLVRNHEQSKGQPFANDAGIIYAPNGAGGTTNLRFDMSRGQWKSAWSSLAGTNHNCAGGVTPWGSWITCEEVGDIAAHGWCFEVGAERGDPTPLADMGRFSHEAVMIDPDTGVVYETEDEKDTSGFYKFVPHVKNDLARGGELFMLKVRRQPNLDLGVGWPIGTTWDVEWVPIPDAAAVRRSTFLQGRLQGAARFQRLEGAWWGDRTGYFLSTNGGSEQIGQVFEYDPRAETLRLIYDSPAAADCSYPDNMTVTPRGHLLLCEDNGGDAVQPERLVGLTLDGRTFTFCRNNVFLEQDYNDRVPAGDYRLKEFAGACYSPDGQWLFVNVQVPGITFAITGPWGNEL